MLTPRYIAVLGGGPSAEREVSLRSSAAVAKALSSLGHHVVELDPQPGKLREQLPAGTDVVFLALHGTYGEDGTVQAELESLGVSYTGCGIHASRLAFDKAKTKEQCLKNHVPTARSQVLDNRHTKWPSGWLPPVVLKPVRQGSSVGLQFVDRPEEFPKALAEALRYDHEVLMEERLFGREVTVGILDGQALPIVEVRPRHGSYDYQNKYTSGATDYYCPADFDSTTTLRIQEAALATFRSVEGRDYGRVDIIVRPDGSPVVLEVNTLPGMTETSLLPKAATAAGIPFAQLCERMISMAIQRKGIA
jgi:D-alanine-D-alanine ligase